MKLRNLMVLTIVVFGIFVLAVAEESKVKWEYIKGGQGIATIQDASFDEVWEETLDILMFGKFKMKGASKRSTHDATTVEKDTGLIVIDGVVGGFEHGGPMRIAVGGEYGKYILKVVVREKDGDTVIKLSCTSGWKKKVIKKFFQLLAEGFKKKEAK